MNKWVQHVKEFAKINKLSYGCALSMPECKESYKTGKIPAFSITKKMKFQGKL